MVREGQEMILTRQWQNTLIILLGELNHTPFAMAPSGAGQNSKILILYRAAWGSSWPPLSLGINQGDP